MAITPKTSTRHPYLAIEWRVIDSLAYADLTYSASTLLVLLTRQLTKDNNGHLQATYSYMRRFRFSENTLSRAIAELISHGLIYRTRSGGYQQGAAQYAVTWLSISKRDGLFLAGFRSCAWRDWQPADKKTPPPKLRRTHLKNGELTTPTPPKIEVGRTRDLSDAVRAATKAKVRESVNEEWSKSGAETEQATFSEVDQAANANTSLIMRHQRRAGRLGGLLDKMTVELEEVTSKPLVLEQIVLAVGLNDPASAEAIYQLRSVQSRLNSLKVATEINTKLQDAERKAFGIDEEKNPKGNSIDDALDRILKYEAGGRT